MSSFCKHIKQAESTNLKLPKCNAIPFIQVLVYKYTLFTLQILMTAKCGVSVTNFVKIVWDIISATVWKVIS